MATNEPDYGLSGESPGSEAVDVRLVGIGKPYGEAVAVDRVDLEVARGEFFTLLGPSGSGKTTTLRLIAGFEDPNRDDRARRPRRHGIRPRARRQQVFQDSRCSRT